MKFKFYYCYCFFLTVGPERLQQLSVQRDPMDSLFEKICDLILGEDVRNLLVCCAESSVDSWVMDFSASFHVTTNSEALQNLVIGDFGKVRLADNRTLKVTGMGDIVLKTPVGFWTLKNVKVVPSLTKSVISVR